MFIIIYLNSTPNNVLLLYHDTITIVLDQIHPNKFKYQYYANDTFIEQNSHILSLWPCDKGNLL